jgi:hypothetical protein
LQVRAAAMLNHTNPPDHAAPPRTISLAHTHRDRRPKSLQIGFEKMVRDDQRLDRLASIPAAGRNGLILPRRPQAANNALAFASAHRSAPLYKTQREGRASKMTAIVI